MNSRRTIINIVSRQPSRFFHSTIKSSYSKTPSSVPSTTSTSTTSSQLTRPAVKSQEVYAADAINGVPPSISRRTVRVYRPAKTAMQSGTQGMESWKLDFDTQQRWENPLMGWASSGDPVQSLQIKFTSKEDAITFAERHGYDYWVDEPKQKEFVKKNYSDNFKYVPGKLRFYKTK